MEKSFLQRRYPKLHKEPEVEKAYKRKKFKSSERVKGDEQSKINAYLQRIGEVFYEKDENKRKKKIDYLKNNLHNSLVIKPEEVPESYFDLQKRIAREQGHGEIEITPQIRRQMIETVRGDQITSMDRWIDYLGSNNASYPDWFKYYAFRSMVGLGMYDKEKMKFSKRSKKTISPFVDLNREALAYVCDELIKSEEKKTIDDKDLSRMLKNGNFGELYAYAIEKITPASEEDKEQIDGKWVKYEQGSDHRPLYESLQGHGTGWCTAGESTAEYQLQTGDFYVYYTKNSAGEYSVPRIAIRMEGDGNNQSIAEVRGINKDQEMEPILGDVVEEKIKKLPGSKQYRKKVRDMKNLTEIEKAVNSNHELTREELLFLYEVEDEIDGFGYEKDPRIEEIKTARQSLLDFMEIYKLGNSMQLFNKLLRDGYIKVIVDNFKDFEADKNVMLMQLIYNKVELDYIEKIVEGEVKWNNNVANSLFSSYPKFFLENINRFPLYKIDKNRMAENLIAKGSGRYVAENLEKFDGGNHKEIAEKLINGGYGRYVAENLDKFDGGNHKEIAEKLIDGGYGRYVAENLEKFEGVNHKEIAEKLIDSDSGYDVAQNLNKFEGLNHRKIAEKLIDSGSGWYVAQNLNKFEGLNHKEIAEKLIDSGSGNHVAHNLNKFEELNKEIAEKLIDSGFWRYVVGNLDEFEGVNHKEIAEKLINGGYGRYVAENLDKFDGGNHKEIAEKLINGGSGRYVAENLDKFDGGNHKEIAEKLIDSGSGRYVAKNLDKFEGGGS